MAGKRIYDTDPTKSLAPLSGAQSANDDKLVIFDVDANETKRIDRSQLAAGLVGDLPFTPTGQVSATTIPTAIAEIANMTMTPQRFSGNGSTVNFTLSVTPASENFTWVFVNGIYQQKDTYSLSGTTLTFSEAPPLGTNNIEVNTLGF